MNVKNIRRLATQVVVAALAMGGMALAGAGSASAAPTTPVAAGQSYQVTSDMLTISSNIGAYAHVWGSCVPGYHVRGEWIDRPHEAGGPYVEPTVEAHSTSGDIYVKSAWSSDQNGGSYANRDATFKSFDVYVGNKSYWYDRTGTVSLTCDANRAA